MAIVLALVGVDGTLTGVARASGAPAPYIRKLPPLLTPWTRSVSTLAPLPDYPRPELERTAWMNLNGRWQYERGAPTERPPHGRTLAETILVPFPVQSPLSGIERADQVGWYRRMFTVPTGWRSRRVMLNFGAVTWAASVYVNGHLVGTHRGSYGSFGFDITSALHHLGENELIVGYLNPIGAAGEPVGKQTPAGSRAIYHTAASGIWQTVWLEPVAATHITGIDVDPQLSRSRASIRVRADTHGPTQVLAEAVAGGRVVASAQGSPGRPLALVLHRPHLWSPSDPFLYDLHVQLLSHGHAVDQVRSYFGMRSISLGRVGGHVRLLLNGHFLFQTGALEQGYWPDGVYTAPTDAALRFDLLAAKRLGYNMLREHEKVEADRWYYWADRLGVLIWQDMPSLPVAGLPPPTAPGHAEFRRELLAMIAQLQMHPSIVTWVPFNEGWGQFDLGGITRMIRALDPSRLVDTQSGSANCCAAIESPASDIRDTHLYFGPFALPSDYRATVIGEYGGVFPFPPRAHRWPGPPTSIGSRAVGQSPSIVAGMLGVQYADLAEEMRLQGLSAAVYTELGAYENEEGILAYDRKAYTLDPDRIRADNEGLIADSQRLASLRPQGPAIPAGSTGLWTFDEGRGSVAADRTRYGHPLELSGGAGWTTGVDGGHALLLPDPGAMATAGGAAIDTRRSFTVSAWLWASQPRESATAVSQLGTDGSAFSLGVRTTPRTDQVRPGEVASGRLAPALRTYWTFAVPTLPTCSMLTCSVQANNHYDDGRLSPPAESWQMVTGVYDASTVTTSLYVDGVPQDVEHPAAMPGSRGPLLVGTGSLDYPDSTGFVGAVDDLRTYGWPLSPAEVWELYRAERAGMK